MDVSDGLSGFLFFSQKFPHSPTGSFDKRGFHGKHKRRR